MGVGDGVGPVEREGVLRVDGDGDLVVLVEGRGDSARGEVDVRKTFGGADELVGEEFGVCLGMVDQAAGLDRVRKGCALYGGTTGVLTYSGSRPKMLARGPLIVHTSGSTGWE